MTWYLVKHREKCIYICTSSTFMLGYCDPPLAVILCTMQFISTVEPASRAWCNLWACIVHTCCTAVLDGELDSALSS
jgi:hypothetical protein